MHIKCNRIKALTKSISIYLNNVVHDNISQQIDRVSKTWNLENFKIIYCVLILSDFFDRSVRNYGKWIEILASKNFFVETIWLSK